MHHSGTHRLFEYWNQARKGRQAPLRSQIAPDAIAAVLPSAFILNADREPAVFRLAGTRLCELFDRELTGTPFGDVFDRDDRQLAERLLQTVTQANAIVVFDLAAHAAGGRSLAMEMIVLPLADAATRTIGALNATTNPVWLGAYPIAPATIMGARVLDPDRDLFCLGTQSAAVMPMRRQAGRPTLRVIEGDTVFAARRGNPPAAGERATFRLLDGGRNDH